ncbi:ATP-grasp domain-containing protein [Oscillatoria sp. CS-180]|uniref:ATP-grasp domain-containing protein n=1 Tax=Oscillatoria sp. CS-180 TaxID=3021720 RepID=UPI00232CFE84|nr:ATP-grasp domain-containing protein [Oscillatoria sp. CS-180]MDB9524549.1 ATP-grasp domain-containing protein [Oscillatoria sp. CS-180]
MKIYNHDITHYTHDCNAGNELYAGRALGLTAPDDKIQLPEALKSEWSAIAAHYAQVGLNHTHDVIWDISIPEMDQHPDHEISVYFFGDVMSPHDTYRQLFEKWDARFHQVVEHINSKNHFIRLAEELNIPVPKTLRFDNLAAAKASNDITFPCFVKPAVSDHGFGITRCDNEADLKDAFAHCGPNDPLQIQEEVNATAFLNLQYEVTHEGVHPVLASEQILEGCVHLGNRYPASHEPWDEITTFATWMGDHGMKGIFAVDVAVCPAGTDTRYVAIECNPRFNGSSYPTIIAKQLGIPAWSSVTYATPLRSLKEIDLEGITFDATTGKGVILINWGTIKVGKIAVLLAGSEAEQAELGQELKARLKL